MTVPRLGVSLLALILTGCAASVPDQALRSAATPASSAPQPDPAERPICRTERVTGSNTPRRVCRTPAQVAAELEASRRITNRSDGTGSGERQPGL